MTKKPIELEDNHLDTSATLIDVSDSGNIIVASRSGIRLYSSTGEKLLDESFVRSSNPVPFGNGFVILDADRWIYYVDKGGMHRIMKLPYRTRYSMSQAFKVGENKVAFIEYVNHIMIADIEHRTVDEIFTLSVPVVTPVTVFYAWGKLVMEYLEDIFVADLQSKTISQFSLAGRKDVYQVHKVASCGDFVIAREERRHGTSAITRYDSLDQYLKGEGTILTTSAGFSLGKGCLKGKVPAVNTFGGSMCLLGDDSLCTPVSFSVEGFEPFVYARKEFLLLGIPRVETIKLGLSSLKGYDVLLYRII